MPNLINLTEDLISAVQATQGVCKHDSVIVTKEPATTRQGRSEETIVWEEVITCSDCGAEL